MKATILAVEGPPEGMDYRKPERYFEDVLEGARLTGGQCSKDIMFEMNVSEPPKLCIMKRGFL